MNLETSMNPEISGDLDTQTVHPGPIVPRVPVPAMVHLGVGDADRAAWFFGEVLAWETERREYRGHVRHYVLGEWAVRPCITDEVGAPAVQLGFQVGDVEAMARRVEDLGGVVVRDELDDEEGPFVGVLDDQGVALAFWHTEHGHRVEQHGWAPPGGLSYFAILVPDVERASSFYGDLLGWPFEIVDAPSYRHVGDHVEAVAMGVLGGSPAPGVALYFIVADLEAVASRVRALGGAAGETYVTGPMQAVDCHDDQGLSFSIAVANR